MTYTVIYNNNVLRMDEEKLYSFLADNGITETTGGTYELDVNGWTRYEGDKGFTCLVHDDNVNEHQYMVIHGFDVDGGFGDSVYKEKILARCQTKKEADMIVEAYGKPHAYCKPYSYLYCGHLRVEKEEKEEPQTFAEFVINNPPSKCWWLTNDVVEVEDDEEDDW